MLKNSVSQLPTCTLHVRRSFTSLKRANGERRGEAKPHYFSFELTMMKAVMTTQGQQQLIIIIIIIQASQQCTEDEGNNNNTDKVKFFNNDLILNIITLPKI